MAGRAVLPSPNWVMIPMRDSRIMRVFHKLGRTRSVWSACDLSPLFQSAALRDLARAPFTEIGRTAGAPNFIRLTPTANPKRPELKPIPPQADYSRRSSTRLLDSRHLDKYRRLPVGKASDSEAGAGRTGEAGGYCFCGFPFPPAHALRFEFHKRLALGLICSQA